MSQTDLLRYRFVNQLGKQMQIGSALRHKHNPDRQKDYQYAMGLLASMIEKEKRPSQPAPTRPFSDKHDVRIDSLFAAQPTALKKAQKHLRKMYGDKMDPKSTIVNWANELTAVVEKSGITATVSNIYIRGNDDGSVRMDTSFDLEMPGGYESSLINYEWEFLGDTAYLSLFEIEDPNMHGKGIAQKLLKNTVDQFDRMGIKKIDLQAAKDAGGYVWAKYGWLPDQKSWDQIRHSPEPAQSSTVATRLNWLQKSREVTDEQHSAISKLLESKDPRSIWAIVNLPNGIGKKLMHHISWDGSMHLDKKGEQRKILDSYLSR